MMSAIEMGPITRLSYQRLRNEGGFVEEEEEEIRLVKRTKSWCRIRRLRSRRSRFRLRIPGLRRFMRKKSRLVSTVIRGSLRKVVKRLIESRPYLGDLFAGNYLFMQVSPSPIKCHMKSVVGHHDLHHHGVPNSSSRYSLGRAA